MGPAAGLRVMAFTAGQTAIERVDVLGAQVPPCVGSFKISLAVHLTLHWKKQK